MGWLRQRTTSRRRRVCDKVYRVVMKINIAQKRRRVGERREAQKPYQGLVLLRDAIDLLGGAEVFCCLGIERASVSL